MHQNIIIKKTGINIVNHNSVKNNPQSNQKDIHLNLNPHENHPRNFITITSNQNQKNYNHI